MGSLESQTNWKRKRTRWGRFEVSAWDTSLHLEIERHLKFGDQGETCSSEALVQSKLKEKRCKAGNCKMVCEHQARDSAGPELG